MRSIEYFARVDGRTHIPLALTFSRQAVKHLALATASCSLEIGSGGCPEEG